MDASAELTYPDRNWPKDEPQVWLMYARPEQRGAKWLANLTAGEYVSWRHGSDAYTLQMRPGDTALLYIADSEGEDGQIVGLGLIASVRKPFVLDKDQRVQRIPIRLIHDWRKDPLDWINIRQETGANPTRGEGAVHPVAREVVDTLKSQAESRYNVRTPMAYNEARQAIDPLSLWSYLEKERHFFLLLPDYISMRRRKSLNDDEAPIIQDAGPFFEAWESGWKEKHADGPFEPTSPEVSTHATSDLWTVDDKLGYAEYARAIYHFLDDPRTEPPLTISIQAPWGGGKTSLMRMLQKQLDRNGYEHWPGAGERSLINTLRTTTRDLLDELNKLTKQNPTSIMLDLDEAKFASVWFNAWRYQSSDQIWAGLAEAIIRGITDRLKPIEREAFLLRLHLNRGNANRIRTKIYDAVFQHFINTIRRFGLWVLTGLLALAGLTWGGMIAVVPASVSAIVGAVIAAMSAYQLARVKTEREPAKFNLSDYVELPDYSEKLGFIHHVAADLRRVFELLPSVNRNGETRRVPLVIFIDDLDRCTPSKVAEVFEAINLFIAGEFPNCYIVIGMDTEMVAAALEQAHQNVIEKLPSYARRVPVGWRFMDKFIQLPFIIPPLDEEATADYSDYLAAAEDRDAREVQARAVGKSARDAEEKMREALDQGKSETEILKQTAKIYVAGEDNPQDSALEESRRLAEHQLESIKRQRYIDERARELKNDSEKVQTLLLNAKEDFSNNPRELKRLANVYRFYSILRLARQARRQPVPTEMQLQNWLKLSLAWPEVVRWLRRSYSEWESDLDSEAGATTAIGYRLSRLESLAVGRAENRQNAGAKVKNKEDRTIQEWADALRAEFGLPKDASWLEDERLFEFIHKTAAAGDEQRLSKGAGQGFW